MKSKLFQRYLQNLLILIPLLVSGCRASSPAFQFGAYSEAERLFSKNEYAKAIEKYEEYLRNHPEGNMAVISHYYMAKSYEGLGDTPKAREIYGKIIKEHAGTVWADFAKARLGELA